MARDDPPRRGARARVRGGDRCRGSASCCARPTAARTSSWTPRGSATTGACAWPTAEIAVMGAPGAVQILHGRRLARDRRRRRRRAAEQARWSTSTRTRFANPYVAAERGYVDDVHRRRADTRRVLAVGAAPARRPSASRLPPRVATATPRCRLPGSRRHRCCSTASASSSPACSTTPRSRSPSRDCAQEEGAEVVLTSFGRVMSLTQRTAERLPTEPEIVELDVTERRSTSTRSPSASAASSTACSTRSASPRSRAWAVASSTRRGTTSPSRSRSRRYSLKALAGRRAPADGARAARSSASTSTTPQAWPVYDWMGVAKSALESTARYLARDLGPRGIRVNLVAAGPIRTIAAKSIPGFERFEEVWAERAPLGWDVKDPRAGRAGLRRAPVRPLPRDHRRDGPRRRRLPRRRRVMTASPSATVGFATP